LYAFLIPPMHTTLPVHLILLHLITQIILGEEHKLLKFLINTFSEIEATNKGNRRCIKV
jgi:hypothetical protein